jgi:hypothetical protein
MTATQLTGCRNTRRPAGIREAQTPSVLATYSDEPITAMPKGDFNPSMNCVRCSATPSPSASRSNTMRLALGTDAPASFINCLRTSALMPLPSSGRSGALVSATRTSPLGSTSSQRGWFRPLANAPTRKPAAAVGVLPSGQPLAGAICTVGIRLLFGSGSCGYGPSLAAGAKRAVSLPQPAKAPNAKPQSIRRRGETGCVMARTPRALLAAISVPSACATPGSNARHGSMGTPSAGLLDAATAAQPSFAPTGTDGPTPLQGWRR